MQVMKVEIKAEINETQTRKSKKKKKDDWCLRVSKAWMLKGNNNRHILMVN